MNRFKIGDMVCGTSYKGFKETGVDMKRAMVVRTVNSCDTMDIKIIEHTNGYYKYMTYSVPNDESRFKYLDKKENGNMVESALLTKKTTDEGIKLDNPLGEIKFSKKFIKDVIHTDSATIVFWKDGTKTVVKPHDEAYDGEKGLAMAIVKKLSGNNYNYFEVFKKFCK